ncbi:MAG TPA: hypothetical protein VMN57_14755 [Anaerolineales bacterium]|nr:hypothetical protein [Anaerolineales bacterium]
MDLLNWIGIFLVVWGGGTLWVAVRKPRAVWGTGKVQGFVQLLTERGAVILFSVLGAAALIGGLALLL